jgi:hypothetical protein
VAAFGDHWWIKLCITDVRIGSGNTLSRDEVVYSDLIYDTAKEHLESPKKGLLALRQLYDNYDLEAVAIDHISVLAAYFGDPDFALDAQEKKRISNDLVGTGGNRLIWLPIMHEVRQLPRFKKFVREIGLVDYWNEFGWPDLCRPTDDGDFVCD